MLTYKVPLSIGDVSGGIGFNHLQVEGPASVGPWAKLEVTPLDVERKPADIDVAGTLKDSFKEQDMWA